MANRNYAKDLESVRNFNKELEKSRALLTDEVGVSKELALQLEFTAAAHQKSLKYSKENNNLAKQQSKVASASLGVIKAQAEGGRIANVIAQAKFKWAKMTSKVEDAVTKDLVSQTEELIKQGKLKKKNEKDEDEAKKLRAEISDELATQADSLLPGISDKAEKIEKIFKEGWRGGVTSVAVGLTAAVGILKSFSDRIDEVGANLGAMGVREFAPQLMKADAEMQKLGYSAGEAQKIATQLTSQFGKNYDLAIKNAIQIGEMAKGIGITADQATNVVKLFSKSAKLSYEQSIQLTKQTALLAKQHDVAPNKVLQDMAENGETFARYMSDGGTNIATAAVQARKLGSNLGSISKIADGLLNFQSSLNAEMEASIMIGRDINLQKARELALTGDMDGMMSEVINQLGTEADFMKLNVIQRDALAAAVGTSAEELAKFVGRQERANMLGKELVEQKSFDELLGEDAMSDLNHAMNTFKSISAEIVTNLGPALNVVGTVIASIAGFLSEAEKQAGLLSLATSLLIGRSVAVAVAKILGSFAGFGGPIGFALGTAAVVGMMSTIAKAKSMKDGEVKSDGTFIMSPKGSVSIDPQDSVAVGTNLTGGGAATDSTSVAIKNDLIPALGGFFDELKVSIKADLKKNASQTGDAIFEGGSR